VTGLMRFILFLAILGVTASGVSIDVTSRTANPAAQAFQVAAGDWGLRIFGVIFWAAAITSVIGAAYTSVSFLTVFRAMDDRGRNVATVVFIAISLAIFLALGSPPALLLVFAGGFNGLILPIGLTIFTWIGFARSDLMGGHHYSRPLLALSAIVCLLTWYMGISSVGTIFAMVG
jgi:Mn2+/Fe2+ NRAMP family transporter